MQPWKISMLRMTLREAFYVLKSFKCGGAPHDPHNAPGNEALAPAQVSRHVYTGRNNPLPKNINKLEGNLSLIGA
jgi:hypothetical protein